MRELIKQVLKEQVETLYGYHVTSKRNLKSIKKNGLEPRVPEDYGTSGDIAGVYIFKTYEDMENALYNWLGERIEEIEEESGEEYKEVALKINLTGMEQYLIDSVDYEWTCVEKIEPDRIIEIIKLH